MPSIRRALTDMLLLFLGAFLYTIAAPPYEWSIAGWFALTPLILVAANTPPRLAFLAGLVYGVLFCLGMAYWVYFAVATYFPLGASLSFLCTVLSYAVFIATLALPPLASLSCSADLHPCSVGLAFQPCG
jgi:apolipoprotein N-acyltransferase